MQKKPHREEFKRGPVMPREVTADELLKILEDCHSRLKSGWKVARPSGAGMERIWEQQEASWRHNLEMFIIAVKKQLATKLKDIRIH